MHDLTLKRMIFTDRSTIGDLFIDGAFECNTLEDTCRNRAGSDDILQKDEKIYGETAIPSGRYEVKMRRSNHFQRDMPFLQDVPHFTDVMFHWGNEPKDSRGCILIGERHVVSDIVINSQKHYKEFEIKLLKLLADGQVFITVMGGYTA